MDIYYKGRKIYQNLSHEECADILHEMSIESYENKNIDLNDIEIEDLGED